MLRLRLAGGLAIVTGLGLLAGCSNTSGHKWFSSSKSSTASADFMAPDCCEGPMLGDGGAFMAGPAQGAMLGQQPCPQVMLPQLSPTPQPNSPPPRLVPQPQATQTPYTPGT